MPCIDFLILLTTKIFVLGNTYPPKLLISGLFEIGGVYLLWLWLRENMSRVLGVIGGFVLFLYGIVPTLQPSHFHRIYAAYRGMFIIMAILWGWFIQGIAPDLFDRISAVIALVGVAIIFYMPRKGEKSIWSKQQQ